MGRGKINLGVQSLRPALPDRWFCISGSGRSGTTALIRGLKAGGVHSYNGRDANCEGPLTQHYIHQDWETIDKLTRKRVKEHPIHVDKVPMMHHAARASNIRRSNLFWPNWIISIRDPLAIAMRHIAQGKHPQKTIGAWALHFTIECRNNLVAAMDLAKNGENYGILLVSYEKLLVSPERTLGAIGDWMGIDLDVKAGAAEITPDHQGYINDQHYETDDRDQKAGTEGEKKTAALPDVGP